MFGFLPSLVRSVIIAIRLENQHAGSAVSQTCFLTARNLRKECDVPAE
jgi:hypothetical protein